MQDLFELVPCWQIYFKISSFAREKSGNFKKWCERVYFLFQIRIYHTDRYLDFFHIKSQRFYDLNWRSYFWFVEAVEFDQLHRKHFFILKKDTCEIFIIYICSSISQNIQIGFFHSSQNNSCRILIVFSRFW